VKRLVTLVLVALLAVAGCSAAPEVAGESPARAEEGGVAAQADGRVLVDVRTPEEFAQGHLAGAELIDFQGPDFRQRIAELPRDEPYFLYCRTGNRSAQAAAVMAELGFTDVVDGGGYEDLVAAGLPSS
jgi:phage shock protein E